jgi:hypothetical protein
MGDERWWQEVGSLRPRTALFVAGRAVLRAQPLFLVSHSHLGKRHLGKRRFTEAVLVIETTALRALLAAVVYVDPYDAPVVNRISSVLRSLDTDYSDAIIKASIELAQAVLALAPESHSPHQISAAAKNALDYTRQAAAASTVAAFAHDFAKAIQADLEAEAPASKANPTYLAEEVLVRPLWPADTLSSKYVESARSWASGLASLDLNAVSDRYRRLSAGGTITAADVQAWLLDQTTRLHPKPPPFPPGRRRASPSLAAGLPTEPARLAPRPQRTTPGGAPRPAPATASPRVFISYSWDSEEHKEWVRELASRLVSSGVQARLDQWFVGPGDSFTRFMEEEVERSDVVLVICTPAYAAKANDRTGGVGFEQQIISARIFGGAPRSKFIPLLRAGSFVGQDPAIPTLFGGIAALDFRRPGDFETRFEELLFAVYGKPRFAPPPLGVPPELTPRSTGAAAPPVQRRDYSPEFEAPLVYSDEALSVIQALSNPATWPSFATMRDGWMASNSESLINTLYGIMAPTTHFKLLREGWERKLAGLEKTSSLQFSLFEALLESLCNDNLIAALEPKIEYSPRVSGWREKREDQQQQYWWQGLSEQRLHQVFREFTVPEAQARRLRSISEFRSHYRSLYDSGSASAQEPLGIAANPLFGFSPAARPVYWRMLILHARIHRALLRTADRGFELPAAARGMLALLSGPQGAFPFSEVYPEAEQFEAYADTLAATRAYLELLVIPKVCLRLRIPIVQANPPA